MTSLEENGVQQMYIENFLRGYHIVLSNRKEKTICNMMSLDQASQEMLLTTPPKNRRLCKDCEIVLEMINLKLPVIDDTTSDGAEDTQPTKDSVDNSET